MRPAWRLERRRQIRVLKHANHDPTPAHSALNSRHRGSDVRAVSTVRYISWPAMILDRQAGVRARGYRLVPPGLEGAEQALTRALHHDSQDVIDDAVTFLEDLEEPAARSWLAKALDNRMPYPSASIRSGIARIDARRHSPDPCVIAPPVGLWQDEPAPPDFAVRLYDVVNQEIATLRRGIQQQRRLSAAHGEHFDDGPGSWAWQANREATALERVSLEDCALAARALGGEGQVPRILSDLAGHRHGTTLTQGLTPLQHMRLERGGWSASTLFWDFDYTGVDLRNLVHGLALLGVTRPESVVSRDYFTLARSSSYLSPTVAWPLYVEQPASLDDHLGLAVPEIPVEEKSLVRALGVLEQMPVMPRRYGPRVADLAITGPARPRAVARRVVEKHGAPQPLATAALRHGKAAVRGSAAVWLAEQGASSALPALREALEAEGSAAARPKLEAAVERLER